MTLPKMSRDEFDTTARLIELMAVVAHKVDFAAFLTTACQAKDMGTDIPEEDRRAQLKRHSREINIAEAFDSFRVAIDRLDRSSGTPGATRLRAIRCHAAAVAVEFHHLIEAVDEFAATRSRVLDPQTPEVLE